MPARTSPHSTPPETGPILPDEDYPDDEVMDTDDTDDTDALDGDPGETAGPAGCHNVTIAPEATGERLDKVLASAVPGLSRSRLKALLEQGHVRADNRTITDASQRVKPGQTYEVTVPAAVPAIPLPQNIPLTIVHEDEHLLVIDKPAGMVVHPAAGNPDGTLVNALLHHCGDRLSGIGGVRRPGIVHRLDKDTSGLMVVAKTDPAHRNLTSQFADRTLSRTYHALVWGVPSPGEGVIEGNIGRSPNDRKRMAVLRSGGKPALTRYRILQKYGSTAALVECKLMTGRTHQIRVHMAHIGHPLIGDPLYGARNGGASRGGASRARTIPEPLRRDLARFPRQALHAVSLQFCHPASHLLTTFSVGLPLDIQNLADSLESL